MGATTFTSDSELCTQVSGAGSSVLLCTTDGGGKRNRVEPFQLLREMAEIYDNIVAAISKQPMKPVSTSFNEIVPHAKA